MNTNTREHMDFLLNIKQKLNDAKKLMDFIELGEEYTRSMDVVSSLIDSMQSVDVRAKKELKLYQEVLINSGALDNFILKKLFPKDVDGNLFHFMNFRKCLYKLTSFIPECNDALDRSELLKIKCDRLRIDLGSIATDIGEIGSFDIINKARSAIKTYEPYKDMVDSLLEISRDIDGVYYKSNIERVCICCKQDTTNEELDDICWNCLIKKLDKE